jgi:ubiquinone biosynthesis protein COQ9
MIAPPERGPERDAAIEALLPLAGRRGWSLAALREAAGPGADLLFPGGAAELVEAASDLADRRMAEAADSGGGLGQRVRALIAARLRQAEPHRAAWCRAASFLALPGQAPVAARCTARTVEAIWTAAGDRAADFSWYTKRASLAAIYGATVLHWLGGADAEASLGFLDRRLAGLARLGAARRRLRARADAA